MSAVTVQEIVEALSVVGLLMCHEHTDEANRLFRLAKQIETHGIAPPDGLRLVPCEPTDKMADSAIQHLDDDPDPQYYFKVNTAKEVYKAMLASAPSSEPPLKLGE